MFSLVASLAVTAIGLALGIFITVWPPQTKWAKRAWGVVAALLFTGGIASLVVTAPVKWRVPIILVQSPIVWTSPGMITASPMPSPSAFGRIPNQGNTLALRQCRKDLKTAQSQLSDSKTDAAKVRQQFDARCKSDAAIVQKIVNADDSPVKALIVDSANAAVAIVKYQDAMNKLTTFTGTHLVTPSWTSNLLKAQNDVWQAGKDRDAAAKKVFDDAAQIGEILKPLNVQ